MKKTVLFLSVVLLFSFTACGQSGKNVPPAVTKTFSQKFSQASKVKWGKENSTEWEAEFKMNGKEYSASFDNSGTWIETEYEINAQEIPAVVKTTLDTESKGLKIGESVVLENKDGKFYEFALGKGKTEMSLVIDNNGKVITKEQAKEEEEKEE